MLQKGLEYPKLPFPLTKERHILFLGRLDKVYLQVLW